VNGFYARLREHREDDELLQRCVDNVVDQLSNATDPKKPGMLLGKIQSGKTRAFLGVIARAFDRDYDVAIVLTKGTRTLANQTVKRIGRDFKMFIDSDELVLFDIMSAPLPLTKSELRRKIVIVAKKQAQNLERILKLFETDHPDLKGKRTLIVDDEADMASIRFAKKSGESNYDQGTIANQMDSLRKGIGQVSFLQVTATPYALYLQPDGYEASREAREVFYPKRPSFTEVLPIHDAYVGGEDYFGGHSPEDPRHYLYIEVERREHDALRSKDARAIRDDRLWTSENARALRLSLVTFLLSVVIRRYQQKELDLPLTKYAMIMHSDTQRAAHDWQWEVVEKLIRAFGYSIENEDGNFRALFDTSYLDLRLSVLADQGHLPQEEEAYISVCRMLEDGEFRVQRVNSDAQLDTLLDPDTAELRLRAHANLFIGGSILDRGITVPNLLSFYYGRNPKRMQADTVLQHSRMYGARPRADLAVTRFYTSFEVYSRLVQIHALETALRDSLESESPDQGVVFIQSDSSSGIIPCAPNKISLSDVVAVKGNSILTPTGFDTVAQSALDTINRKIRKSIPEGCVNANVFCEIELPAAIQIIDDISESLSSNYPDGFDWDAMKGLLRYYSGKSNGRVLLLVEEGRQLSREASGDRSGISILGSAKTRDLVKEATREAPALVILKQVGGKELGWKAGPFYWPMLASPPQAKACVFATKTAN